MATSRLHNCWFVDKFVVDGKETTVASLLASISTLNELVADLKAEVKDLSDSKDDADTLKLVQTDLDEVKKNITTIQDGLLEEAEIRYVVTYIHMSLALFHLAVHISLYYIAGQLV